MYIQLGPFLTQLHLTLKINVFQPADSTFLSSKSINKLESHLFLASEIWNIRWILHLKYMLYLDSHAVVVRDIFGSLNSNFPTSISATIHFAVCWKRTQAFWPCVSSKNKKKKIEEYVL